MDHCPPKALFTKKQRAKGLEFGICNACHQPTRDIDAIVATMSRLMPEPRLDAEKNDIEKYAKGLINNHPNVANLFSDGETLPDGNFQIQAKGENASRMHYAMHAFCARLGLALYREKAGKFASENMRIYANYYSAQEIYQNEIPDAIFKVFHNPTPLAAGRNSSDNQFLYDTYYDGNPTDYFVIFASVRESFCTFVVIQPDLLEFEITSNKGAVFRPGFLKGLDYRDVEQWQRRRREGLQE